MRVLTRPHPLAITSIASFVAAMLTPFVTFGLSVTPYSVIALAALAAPFALLSVAHLYLCRTWRRNLAVALVNVPVWLAWQVAVVAMWYFQPGLPGAVVFGAALCALAAAGLLLVRLVREPAAA